MPEHPQPPARGYILTEEAKARAQGHVNCEPSAVPFTVHILVVTAEGKTLQYIDPGMPLGCILLELATVRGIMALPTGGTMDDGTHVPAADLLRHIQEANEHPGGGSQNRGQAA